MIAETEHDEDIVYARVGKYQDSQDSRRVGALTENMTDPKTFEEARAGIPVSTQRRFDVYPDVSKGL